MNEEKSVTLIPVLETSDFKNTQRDLIKFVKSNLRMAKNVAAGDSGDYGVIPYTKKMSLLKPGAEKLAKLFGLVPSYEIVKTVEDFEKGFVFYKYRCILTHFATGKPAGEAIRSANSKEKQVGSKSIYDAANSVEAKAQKRALVAAVVQATMASEIFDADISEFDEAAPGRTVTEDEDPKRIKKISALFAAASDRGFNQDRVKNAIYKEYNVTSIKDITTDQIVDFTEKITTSFRVVSAGSMPEKFDKDVIQAEVVEEKPIKYFCKGEKHTMQNRVETTFENPWCSYDCEKSYYGPMRKDFKGRLEAFKEKVQGYQKAGAAV